MSEENSGGARKKDYGDPAPSNQYEESEQGKRQRTTPSRPSRYETLGDIPASPPKFISLEELIKAGNGVKNMVLAHEIALNKDFKLEAPGDRVKDVIQKAFWDILESELAEDPPNYTRAIVLFEHIKHSLLDLLLPQHTRIHQQISEVLDMDLIRQQASAGTLDFQQYAQYVISVMGKLCAPVRDENIANLTKTTNVIEVFKGVLETISLMKLDMANFTIKIMRPEIVANSIQYEKKKFQDFLSIDEEGGLTLTKEWLRRHLNSAEQHTDEQKKIAAVINDAYMEFLEWDEQRFELPETAIMDRARIIELKQQFEELSLAGAILLLTFAQSGPDLCSIEDFKKKAKTDTLILLKDREFKREEDLKGILEEVSVKLKDNIEAAIEQYGIGGPANADNLQSQISELIHQDYKIRSLLNQRIREFLLATITSQTAEPMKIPAGFSSLKEEVTELAGNFLRLTSHNRAVYEEYYIKIVKEFMK